MRIVRAKRRKPSRAPEVISTLGEAYSGDGYRLPSWPALVGLGDLDQNTMRAPAGDPAPLLPGHVRIVRNAANVWVPGLLELVERAGNVLDIKPETIMDMLAVFVQAAPKRCFRRRLDELDFRAVVGNESRPSACGPRRFEILIAHEALFQLLRIEHGEDFRPIIVPAQGDGTGGHTCAKGPLGMGLPSSPIVFRARHSAHRRGGGSQNCGTVPSGQTDVRRLRRDMAIVGFGPCPTPILGQATIAADLQHYDRCPA